MDSNKSFASQVAPVSGYLLYGYLATLTAWVLMRLYLLTHQSSCLDPVTMIREDLAEKGFDPIRGFWYKGLARQNTERERDTLYPNPVEDRDIRIMRAYSVLLLVFAIPVRTFRCARPATCAKKFLPII